MDWNAQWIGQVLERIPAGSGRRRMEAELRDHLETLCRDLTEAGWTEAEARAESLRVMGRTEALREEYEAAWRQSLTGRLEILGYRLKTWAAGFAAMLGAHLLAAYLQAFVCEPAYALPGDSPDPWVQMIRGAADEFRNSWLWMFLPLVFALLVGARYLGRRFRTSPRPAALICPGLLVHWAFIAWFDIWWEAVDDHRTFWAELWGYLTYGPTLRYYACTLALCVLLAVVFGRMAAEKERPAAA